MDTHAKDHVAHLCPTLRTWAQRWMRQAHALDSPQPLAPPGGVGARGQHCQVGEACGCRGCAVSAAQAVGGTTPHAAGHQAQMALVAHAPNTYTQAQGASPQDPERRGHATRQYTVKVSLLTSEVPHPVHTAPVARVGTHRVQEATGRERRRMASGDAQKVWFPELIAMVRQAGDAAMSIDTLLSLRDRLNTTLQTIRHTRQILPAMMWCPHCQARHRAAPPSVSVRATILALGRYTCATASEVQTLEKQWNRYRKQHQLDRDGQPEVAGAVPHQRPRVTR